MLNNKEDNFDESQGFSFDQNGKNPFSSPDGYFDSFSKKLLSKIEAEEELKAFSILSSIPKQKAFTVPDHYFENAVEWQTELAAYQQLSKIPRPAKAEIEENYFEELTRHISYKVELTEELKSCNRLYAMDKQHGFTLEPSYFESLADRIKERIFAQPALGILDKVLRFILRPQFALSFGVALIIGASILFYNHSETKVAESGDCQTLACMEKSDLLNESTIPSFDEDNLFDMVDVNKLDKQINKPDSLVHEQYLMDNVNTDQLMEEL